MSPGLPDQQADGRQGSHGAFPMCRIALPHPKSGEARLAVAHTSFRLPAVAVQASLLRSFGYSWFSVDGCGFPQNIQELVGSEVRSISVPSCHSSVGRWAVMTSVNPACFFVFRCYGRHRFSAGRRGPVGVVGVQRCRSSGELQSCQMVHSSEPSPVLFPCRLKYRYEATNTLRDFTTALSVSHQPEAGIRLYKRLARMLPFLFPACISVCLHAAGSGVSAHTEAVHDPGSIACAVSAHLWHNITASWFPTFLA